MNEDYKRITVERQGNIMIMRFKDADILDEINIQEIGEEMYGVADSTPAIKLIVDFDGVEYLSSSALGKLITLKKKVEGKSGILKLCRIKSEILEVFKITKLDTIFDIYGNLTQALQSFGP